MTEQNVKETLQKTGCASRWPLQGWYDLIVGGLVMVPARKKATVWNASIKMGLRLLRKHQFSCRRLYPLSPAAPCSCCYKSVQPSHARYTSAAEHCPHLKWKREMNRRDCTVSTTNISFFHHQWVTSRPLSPPQSVIMMLLVLTDQKNLWDDNLIDS